MTKYYHFQSIQRSVSFSIVYRANGQPEGVEIAGFSTLQNPQIPTFSLKIRVVQP